MALPTITLMQADEVPFHREGWIYEEKYDGWRMAAYKDGTAVRLVSRAGKDHARRFAELAGAIRALPFTTLILDGEVAIFDDQLISRFEWFRKRPEDASSTPPIYMAFDCLYLEGRDQRPIPLSERRKALEQVVENDHKLIFLRGGWLTTNWWRGPRWSSGATRATWARTRNHRTAVDVPSHGSR